jgi:hypothetical protein
LDARPQDGSRVAAILPPCSIGGPTLAIRRIVTRHLRLEDLVRSGAITTAMLATLQLRAHSRSSRRRLHAPRPRRALCPGRGVSVVRPPKRLFTVSLA